jgi:hypothetical protein
MTLIPFEPHHVSLMTPQAAQFADVAAASPEAISGDAWTAVVDGLPVACGGLIEMWAGRAYAWALLSPEAGPHLLAMTRAIRSRLARASFRRVEMAVDVNFEAGRRWALMLGFEQEARLRCFLPGGRDAWLFARIQ